MAYSIWSGLSQTGANSGVGIYKWSSWDNGPTSYQTSPAHLVIDTPNVINLPSAPNPVPSNGELCGSGPGNAGYATNITAGPAKNLGGGLSWPGSHPVYELGCVDVDAYVTATGDTSFGAWSAQLGVGGYKWDVTTAEGAPGDVLVDSDTYIVVINAQLVTGESAAVNNASRVHYHCAVGNLGAFLADEINYNNSGIGRLVNLNGGIINNTYTDEQAAAVWLCTGYGLLLNGLPAFTA